jgi:hypothetical protein
MAQSTTTTDWTTESGYWRNNYKTRPYAQTGHDYEFYEPAYRYGFESAAQHRERSWNDVQADLERGWENYKLRGKLAWNEAKDAIRDAWDRATTHRSVAR